MIQAPGQPNSFLLKLFGVLLLAHLATLQVKISLVSTCPPSLGKIGSWLYNRSGLLQCVMTDTSSIAESVDSPTLMSHGQMACSQLITFAHAAGPNSAIMMLRQKVRACIEHSGWLKALRGMTRPLSLNPGTLMNN
jgi:hypothetical protein